MASRSPDKAHSPARVRTRLQRDERADAIATEASKLFAARGFRGTSIAAVAEAVGLTDAGVLHHFPTKRALLAAVLERWTVDHIGITRSMFQPGGVEALQRLRAWGAVMETQLHETALEVTLGAESLDESADLHGFFQKRYAVLLRWLTRAVQEGVDSGEFAAGTDAGQEASEMVAVLDGLRLQWYFGHVPSLADAVRVYIDRVIARLTQPAAEAVTP